MARSGKLDLSQCRFVGLDEWIGMDKTMEGSCQHYIYSNFFNPLNIAEERITVFNARATDPEKECRRMDNFIFSNGTIDLALVGVGVNGHIGLNEPGTSFDLYCHHAELEETTKQVAQKYFTEDKILTRGITLGLKHILESKTVVVVANGAKKTGIIKKIIHGPVTEYVPGSALQKHTSCHFFLDQEAGALITI
jgi:glucosamine-6-phosphate isomerase